MREFEFSLGEPVVITVSGEAGEVIGRADYAASEDCYLVRYKAADGRAVEAWWSTGALEKLQ
jgi:hypothetical protein